jgi:ferritin-like metal-binding protein YciE
MEDYKGSPALDAGCLPPRRQWSTTRFHATGRLKAWAEELGLDDAADLLQETLDEEEATNKAAINQQAEAVTGPAPVPRLAGHFSTNCWHLSRVGNP